MTIGMRIAKLRTRNNWSQSRLAREMKTNVTTIQKWENGSSLPSATHIIALSQLFHTSSDFLLGIDNRSLYLWDDELTQNEIDFLNDIIISMKKRKPI